MIRRRLHARWTRDTSDGERIFRSFRVLLHDSWIDTFTNWHVATFGETSEGPLWLRPACSFHGWCMDWRNTLDQRKPLTGAEKRALRDRRHGA